MARYVFEGQTKVSLVNAIATIATPSLSELNAGTDISGFLTKDGLNTPQNQNMVDSATLADTFDAQLVGSWGGSIELTGFRDNVDDDFWDLLSYGLNSHLVIRYGEPQAGVWANGDIVAVYPVQTHQPIMSPTAANEQARFKVMAAVTKQPNLIAVAAT